MIFRTNYIFSPNRKYVLAMEKHYIRKTTFAHALFQTIIQYILKSINILKPMVPTRNTYCNIKIIQFCQILYCYVHITHKMNKDCYPKHRLPLTTLTDIEIVFCERGGRCTVLCNWHEIQTSKGKMAAVCNREPVNLVSTSKCIFKHAVLRKVMILVWRMVGKERINNFQRQSPLWPSSSVAWP